MRTGIEIGLGMFPGIIIGEERKSQEEKQGRRGGRAVREKEQQRKDAGRKVYPDGRAKSRLMDRSIYGGRAQE